MIKTSPSRKIFSSMLLAGTIAVASGNSASAQLVTTLTTQTPQLYSYTAGSAAPASAGCDGTTMAPALNSAGSFTYNATYQTSMGLIHQPTSFASCLNGLLGGTGAGSVNSLVNAFNGTGGGISGLLTSLVNSAISSMVTQLEQQACTAANNVAANLGINSNVTCWLHPPAGGCPVQ